MRRHDGRLRYSPSDLNAFLACPHLTSLELAVARGQQERPFRNNPYAELIRRKGDEHEAAYLAAFDVRVARIGDPHELGWDAAAAATEEAIRDRASVIYQAALVDDDWHGLADFLELQPDGSYEVVDTKLARRAKPAHLLQLCFYTEQVARLQGGWPERMHVVNGLGERESFRPQDFLAYYRRLRARFVQAVANHQPTYPYPVDHCSLCEFLERCQRQWDEDDHLSLVAGIRRTQVERLNAEGVQTLEGLATMTETKIPKLRAETLGRLKEQAALQLHRRRTGELQHRLLPLQPERGFALLPEPSAGDIWLDFEGDPWYEPARGLEYLTGWVWLDDDGEPRYEHIWSLDREQEKAGFERFIDLVHERRARFPGMHVYHYAPYERAALQRLMGEHGTREAELDDLLRGEVLVDLYRVTRQALRLSLPSYSIKEVEAFYGFERGEEVAGGGSAVVAFEEWLEARADSILAEIRAYNEDDCRSLFELHRWLLELRPEEVEWRLPPEEREVKEETKERLEERARVKAELLADAEEGSPRRLLAQLLEYHRREEKPQWWAYFNNLQLDQEELIESTETIGALELVERVEDGRSYTYTLRFPPQEHKLGRRAVDPATENRYEVSIDDELGLVRLRRDQERADEPLPSGLIPPTPLGTYVQREAVLRFAQVQERYPALVEILERRPPRASLGGSLDEAAASLDGSYLFVQGPPGSGKTWLGARMALELMRRGQRVGMTSLSHKAIHKFLGDLRGAALEAGFVFRGRKKASGDPETQYEDEFVDSVGDNAAMCDEELQLLAGTSFLFSREELDQHVDTLFVDEAGQVALADVLAVGCAARNVVLLGDPNQLAQVSQGSHPAGAEASVLQHLLGADETLQPGMGVFLEQTWRMRPEVNAFVSETFYDGRLRSAPVCSERSLAAGNGIRFLPVEHEGNRTQSPEEAAAVAGEIGRLLETELVVEGGAWLLGETDVIVVAPYNAHVRCLREALPPGVAVGTVDKFQGQQAPVVFYAMGSSSSEDAPRGLDFLFSRNRLNVAISRAQCLAYLVCSPRLLDANCRTVEQMRLANALCRLVETASAS
jgi:predicted RecB family nuclease